MVEDLKIWDYIPYKSLQSVFFKWSKYTEIATRLPLREYAWSWSVPVRIRRRSDSQWLCGYKYFKQLIQKLPFDVVHANATSKSSTECPPIFSAQIGCFPSSNPKVIVSTSLDTLNDTPRHCSSFSSSFVSRSSFHFGHSCPGKKTSRRWNPTASTHPKRVQRMDGDLDSRKVIHTSGSNMIGVRKRTSNIVASEFIWKSYQKETVDSPKKMSIVSNEFYFPL